MSLFGSPDPSPSLVTKNSSGRSTDADASRDRIAPNEAHIGQPSPMEVDFDDGEDDLMTDDDDEIVERLPRKLYNRFRRWYDEELGLVKGFETAAAQDLSYNLFGLVLEKRTQYASDSYQHAQPWTTKYRWIVPEQNAATFSKDIWAAWPLHPDRVPTSEDWKDTFREGAEDFTEDGIYYYEYIPTRPQNSEERLPYAQAQLEQALSTVVMEQARRKFRQAVARAQMPPPLSTSQPTEFKGSVDLECLQCLRKKQVCTGSGRRRPCLECATNNLACSLVQTATPYFAAYLESLSLVLDEEKSLQTLQPSSRAVVDQADALFAGLQSSRRGQLSVIKPRAPNKKRRIETEKTGDSNNGVQTKVRGEAINVNNADSNPSAAEETWRTAADNRTLFPGKTASGFTLNHKLGLRDWSDILSMAANVGWNSSALHRAKARCSKLFGESMSFVQLDGRKSVEEQTNPTRKEIASLSGWSLESLWCPHKNCERNSRPYSNRQGITDHILLTHKWNPVNTLSDLSPIAGCVHVDGFMELIPPKTALNVNANNSEDKGKNSAA